MEFLGHQISSAGRCLLKNYTEWLQSFTRPQTVTQLQRFLGTVNYYRSCIRYLASITEPLYALTRKRVVWVWCAKCEEAFQQLRHELSKGPVTLSFPDWKEAFHIMVKPIEYFSSALISSQKNYSAGLLETWAAIATIR